MWDLLLLGSLFCSLFCFFMGGGQHTAFSFLGGWELFVF